MTRPCGPERLSDQQRGLLQGLREGWVMQRCAKHAGGIRIGWHLWLFASGEMTRLPARSFESLARHGWLTWEPVPIRSATVEQAVLTAKARAYLAGQVGRQLAGS